MTNLYQSDVRSLSDEELRVLSEELSDAYEHAYDDDSYWTDEAAEARYWEMRREIRRRWDIAHPEWKSIPLNQLVRESLKILAGNLDATMAVNQLYGSEFNGADKKVGDTIIVNRLPRAPWLSVLVKP